MDGQRAAGDEAQWYVMRDFTQGSKHYGYQEFEQAGFEVFTPLTWRLTGRLRDRALVPFIRDLFFVHSERERLDAAVALAPDVTYRFVRGGYRKAMTVPRAEMERFVKAARVSRTPVYYRADEVTPEMRGRRIQIVGGQLDGYEGGLIEPLTSRGSRQLLVELPGFFAMGVKVQLKYIRFIDQPTP